MITIIRTFSHVSRVCTCAESRVLTIFRPVISHVAPIAMTWLHSRLPNTAWSRNANIGNVPRTRIRPAAMVAIDAGLAIMVHVHV